MRKPAMVLLSMLLACGGCGWMKMPKVKLSEDKPEVKVQKRIAVVLRGGDDVKFYRAMSELTEVSRDQGWDAQRLLNEVIDYYGRIDSNNELAVYYRLLETLKAPRSAMVAAAAPKLEAGGANQEICKTILTWASPGDGRGRTDFAAFATYLQQAQAPSSLVLWMYERDPGAALWQIVAIYGDRMDIADRQNLALAEHVISEILWRQQRGLLKPDQFEGAAADQLEVLSKYREWYVKLYVAQVLATYPRLAKDGVAERLAADGHPLVSRVGKSIRRPTTRPA